MHRYNQSHESAKLRAVRSSCPWRIVSYVPHALCALMPHVPRGLHALAPYVLPCLTCLILYMLSFSMCLMPFVPRVLRALVPHVASCRLCSCVSRASCSTCRPRRPVRPPGMGVKNMGNRQIRLRRYKIKRFLAQPKNVEVKQNGRVVGRIVVRRSTVYPGTRRRNYY